jgi:hypothetical protein
MYALIRRPPYIDRGAYNCAIGRVQNAANTTTGLLHHFHISLILPAMFRFLRVPAGRLLQRSKKLFLTACHFNQLPLKQLPQLYCTTDRKKTAQQITGTIF